MCVWNKTCHCQSPDIQKGWNKGNRRSSPCHDDKEIQSVPRVPEVTASTKDSQGDHLYNHLQSEEDVDECIKSLTERHKVTKRLCVKNEKEENVILPQMNLSGHNKKKAIIHGPFSNVVFYLVKLLYRYTIYWSEDEKLLCEGKAHNSCTLLRGHMTCPYIRLLNGSQAKKNWELVKNMCDLGLWIWCDCCCRIPY